MTIIDCVLTGLPNRSLFNDRLGQALEMASRQAGGVAVMCLDLDRFKVANDLLGHNAGDQLLLEIAERLRMTVRSMDTVGRLGDEEFAIIQPIANLPEAAASLSQRVIAGLSKPFEINGQQVQLGISIGIAMYPGDGGTGPKLLKNAGIALHRAKGEGGGRYCFFEPAIDLQSQQRRSLEQDLRFAIERGEMTLQYQPMFELASCEIDGFEALLRWTHPRRGSVPPSEFIPVAEKLGLITSLGRWVLERACAEAASWERPLQLAVNISPAQFRKADLPGMIGAILARTGLPPDRLEIEVTEGVLIEATDRALEVLTDLAARGIRLSLDDFGTGYSSLSYVRRFPFNKLKIDRSFVAVLETDDTAKEIVRAILALGRSLQLSVTAEGVETREQLELLRDQQCHHVQGFLMGRPVDPAQVAELIRKAPAGVPASSPVG